MKVTPTTNLKELHRRLKNRDLSEEPFTDDEREILEELINQAKVEPYKDYVPNAAAADFIDSIANMYETGNRLFCFSAANGVGKCLPLDTPILMADGTYKPLSDITPGDMVIGHSYDSDKIGSPTKVLNVMRSGVKKLYKVSFKDGTSLIASEEHKFPVKLRSGRACGSGAIKKISISELIKRRYTYTGGKPKFQQPLVTVFAKQEKMLVDPYLDGS